MTKLDIYAEWSVYFVGLSAGLLALLQTAGLPYLNDRTAIIILAVLTNLSVFLPVWVKKAQDLYDRIKAAGK